MNKKSNMNEFKQLEDLLTNADVHSSKYEDIILNRLKYKLETGTIKLNYMEEKDGLYMKKKFFRPATIAALSLTILILGGSAAYASGTLDSLIAHFQVGHAQIKQYAPTHEEPNDVNIVSDKKEPTYEGDTSSEEKSLTLEEIKAVAKSNIKLPNYLPEGYAFKNATASYEGADVNVEFSNASGDAIVILASTTKEATCDVASTEKVTETSIDGKKVILSGNCALWESKDATYQLYWNYKNSNEVKLSSDDIAQVSKIIESMK